MFKRIGAIMIGSRLSIEQSKSDRECPRRSSKKILIKVVLLSLLTFSPLVLSAAPTGDALLLSSNQRVNLLEHLYIFHDNSQLHTVQSIEKNTHKFEKLKDSTVPPFFSGTRWFLLKLRTENPEDSVIQFRFGYIDELDLYYQPGIPHTFSSGNWITESVGALRPYASRSLQVPLQSFPLSLPASFNGNIFIRMQAVNGGIPEIILSSKSLFLRSIIPNRIINCTFYGIGLGIAAYNLLLFFITRERDYGLYVGFVLGAAGSIAFAYDGVTLGSFGITVEHEFKSLLQIAFIACLFAVTFFKSFLSIDRSKMINHLHLNFISLALIASFIFSFFNTSEDTTWVIAGLIPLVFISLITIGIQHCRQKSILAYYYIASTIPLVCCVLIAVLSIPQIGVIKDLMMVNIALKVSFTLQLISLSFGLAHKIKIYQARELAASSELYSAKLYEARIQAKKEHAEKLQLSKDNFLNTMSTAIRSPLNRVFGNSQLLNRTELTGEKAFYVTSIYHSGISLVQIVDDILDFEKITDGNLIINRKPTDVRATLKESIYILSSNTADAVNITFHIDDDVPQLIETDPVRYRQILINLLSNACKFTSEGEITIDIRLENRATGLALKTEIKDTGIGMSSDQSSKLFSRYTQADESINRKYGGTGLGLSICKSLVKLLDGDIGFTSKLEVGSNFWFSIPINKVTAIESGIATTDNDSDDSRVLPDNRMISTVVCEDNMANQKVACGLLEALKVSTHYINNIEDVTSYFEAGEEPIDFLFIDFELYESNANNIDDALKYFSQRTGHSRPNVLLSTANVKCGASTTSKELPAERIIYEPIQLEKLAEAINGEWVSMNVKPKKTPV